MAGLPDEEGWTFEIKYDGYRALAITSGKKVSLFSRNEKSLDKRFPGLLKAFAKLKGDYVIDGEIVAFGNDGKPSFQILQNTTGPQSDVVFYAFDLIHHAGIDLQRSPIETRREALDKLLAKVKDPIRQSPVLDAPGHEVMQAVKKMGMEGVVGKRLGSLYESGERSGEWIKMRNSAAQEFVIGGYTMGGHGFESLIVGVYEGSSLIYVARVKNGFVPRTRAEVFAKLKKLAVAECPFANLPEKAGARWGEALTAKKMAEVCRWVKPLLVCQVSFVEWTDSARLRHSSFIAMRGDKKAAQVVRET